MPKFKQYFKLNESYYEITISDKDKKKIDKNALSHNTAVINILNNLKDTAGSMISLKDDLDDIVDYLDKNKIKYKVIIKR